MLLFWWKSWQCCSKLILWACSRNLNLIENLVWVQHYALCYPQESCPSFIPCNTDVCAVKTTFTLSLMGFWAFLLVLCVSIRFPWTSASLLLIRFLACHPSALWSSTRHKTVRIHVSFSPLCCMTPFTEQAFVTSHPGTISSHLSSTWPRAVRKNHASVLLAVPPVTTALIAKWHLFQSQEESEGILGFGTPPLSRH